MDLFKWYKEQVEKNQKDLPGEIWDRIEEELNVEDVWQRIDKRLNKDRFLQRSKRMVYLAAASIAMLLMVRVYQSVSYTENPQHIALNESTGEQDKNNIYLEPDNSQPTNNNNKTNNSKESVPGKQSQNTSEKQQKQEQNIHNNEQGLQTIASKTITIKETYHRKPIENIPNTNETIQNGRNNTDITKEKPALPKELKKKNYLASNEINNKIENSDINLHSQLNNPEDITTSRKTKNRNYYIGFFSKLQNTWLLNNTTIKGLRSDEMTKTIPNFSNDFAFYAGIDISNTMSIMIEADFRLQNQQKYYEYVNGDYVSKEIRLNYNVLSAQMKYNFYRFFNSSQLRANLVLGGYGGLLKYGQLKVKDTKRNVENQYNKYDVGFIIGYEFDIRFFNRIALIPGVRYKQGLINLYRGDGVIPASFNKTYATTIDFYLGINYIIH